MRSRVRRRRLTGPAPTCAERHSGTPTAASAPRSTTPSPPPPATTSCPGRRRAARPTMPSSFLAASASSSASSPLSYLIPAASRQPAPPPLLMGQGYSSVVDVLAGVQTGGVAVDAAAAVAPTRQGARNAGRPPLPRPPPRQCPRCHSGNTKFCYYNNYSLAQPRYLCKACRRHWTEGGTLRDVPVGGGRKNRRGGKGGGGAAASAAAAQGGAGGVGGADAFPDLLRQLVQFQPTACAGGGGYAIDLSAWQQMAAATAPPQGADDASSLAGAADANCGALQYWGGWQQDDMPGLDGAC